MTKIYTGEAYFPCAWQDSDGLSNNAVTDPLIIYTAPKLHEDEEIWELGPVTAVSLQDAVEDFVFMLTNPNTGKIDDDRSDMATNLALELVSLAKFIRENINTGDEK
jgi:hypothetical protein